MPKKKVLFVCSANLLRSVTAEKIFRDYEGLDVKSAGTAPYAETVITKDLIHWADIIFTMEDHHKEDIIELVPDSGKKVIVLHIPDIYHQMDPKLIKILKEKVPPYLK